MSLPETIAAIATAPGKGGVGVIRVSGGAVVQITTALLGQLPAPRMAHLRTFKNTQGEILDQGLVLYFPAPHSFTGEDILELHGHGGPLVMDMLLEHIIRLGARLALPGEFSERAFLNGKIDLAQAEAVADLIEAGTREAVLGANRSLQGDFSREINQIAHNMMQLRMRIEASLDFPDEPIDVLAQAQLEEQLRAIEAHLRQLLEKAQQGVLLKEGISMAIIGQPNAGKSSLLNYFTQSDTAIVTDIAGTTRDIIKETIHLDGLPIHLVDTAGIRENADVVEQEGVRRAYQQQALADRILLIVDATQMPRLSDVEQGIINKYTDKVTIVVNKVDLTQELAGPINGHFLVSVKNGQGMQALKAHIKACAGLSSTEKTGIFSARRRHLSSLENAQNYCRAAFSQLHGNALELMAQELRMAHTALGEIVGKVTPEDVLGEIFSRFCIGK